MERSAVEVFGELGSLFSCCVLGVFRVIVRKLYDVIDP
jgi:hypothetical protein